MTVKTCLYLYGRRLSSFWTLSLLVFSDFMRSASSSVMMSSWIRCTSTSSTLKSSKRLLWFFRSRILSHSFMFWKKTKTWITTDDETKLQLTERQFSFQPKQSICHQSCSVLFCKLGVLVLILRVTVCLTAWIMKSIQCQRGVYLLFTTTICVLILDSFSLS